MQLILILINKFGSDQMGMGVVVALFTEKEYTEERHDCKKSGVLGLGQSKSEGAVGHQGVGVLQAAGCRSLVL